MPTFSIFIAAHERYEAAEAYADLLTPEQIELLKDIEEECDWRLISDQNGTRLEKIVG